MNEVKVSIGSRSGAAVGVSTAVGALVREATVSYQTAASGTEIPTGEWLSSPPEVAEGQYLWTKSYVLYSTGASYTAYSVGYHGEKGDKGDKGEKGDSGVYVGTDTPAAGIKVWVNPDGENTFTPITDAQIDALFE